MRSRLTACVVAPLLVLCLAPAGAGTPPQLTASAAPSVRVESAWGATVGSNGANGKATVRAFDTARGSVVLSLRRLTPSAKYAVTIRHGACGSLGKQVVAIGTFTATRSGALSATAPLTTAQVAAIRGAAVGTKRISLVAGSGPKARCGTLAKSLAVTPQVWFGPLPNTVFPWRPKGGSIDFDALFGANAPWPRASGGTHVFKFYPDSFDSTKSDAYVRRIIAALRARDIAIALEHYPLEPAGGCGNGVDGFGGGPAEILPIIRRVTSLGGSVRFLDIGEAFDFGGVNYDDPAACRWSTATIAQKLAAYVRVVHAEFPDIEIGLIEPYRGPAWVGYIEEWIAAYEAAADEPLPFFHLDVDWTASGWLEATGELQAWTRAREIRFGLFYTAWPPATSDAAWFAAAQSNLLAYELDGAGPPDDAIFQVWTDKPDRALPETGATTLTRLVADYVRTRTSAVVAATPATSGGTLAVTGTVQTLGGDPVAGGSVAVSATPRDGPYQVQEFRGTVPAGASQAVIGIRVNKEGAGPGAADLTFYEVGYAEGAGAGNLVPDGDFGSGWETTTDASVSVVPSDRGTGNMFRVVATPTQAVGVESASFAVTPGATYRFWIAVRVPESSVGSAYIAPIFLKTDWSEVRRDIHQLAPAPIPVGTTTTDATGGYTLTSSSLEAGRYRLLAEYAGDATFWPARARTEVTVP